MKNFLILIFLLTFWSFQNAFWASWENYVPTIKEIQDNIEELQKEEKKLQYQWQNFRIGNESISGLLKTNLSEEQQKALELHISSYNNERAVLESEQKKNIEYGHSLEETQKNIFLLKEEFYKALLPYIQIERLPDYLKYVESDTFLNEKSKIINSDIQITTKLQEDRIEEIQENISDHSKQLRKQIEEKMTLKVQEKLDTLIQEEKFQKLSNAAKIMLFEKFIEKVNERAKGLSMQNTTSFTEEQQILYTTLENILSGYINKWR